MRVTLTIEQFILSVETSVYETIYEETAHLKKWLADHQRIRVFVDEY